MAVLDNSRPHVASRYFHLVIDARCLDTIKYLKKHYNTIGVMHSRQCECRPHYHILIEHPVTLTLYEFIGDFFRKTGFCLESQTIQYCTNVHAHIDYMLDEYCTEVWGVQNVKG